MPTLRDVLEKKGNEVVTIGPDRTIHEAIERLVSNRIGSLVVRTEEGGVAGILTERDILRIVHDRPEEMKTAKVGDLSTKDLVYGVPDDELDYAMKMMTEHRFRHLPVLADGELVGLVSIGDIVKTMNSARAYEIRMLRQYLDAGTPS
jgi:CBS domain-containing protein